MDLYQLRCFIAVAEELHFGRAAKRLFITQPPLSRQIQLLEHSLGVQLLERTNRSVQLTRAGQHFLTDAQRILAFADQARQLTQQIAKGEQGKLSIGFTAVCGYKMIPELLKSVEQHLPHIELVLQELVSSAQMDALLANMIDVGFVRYKPNNSDLKYSLIHKEPMIVAVPNNHPLANNKSVDLQDLKPFEIIMYSPVGSKYLHDLITGALTVEGIAPKYRYYLGQTHSILGLVSAGLGIAIVQKSAEFFFSQGVTFLPLNHSNLTADLYMAVRENNNNPALSAFIAKKELIFSEALDF